MATTCTRCEGTGFLNLFQIPNIEQFEGNIEAIQNWITENSDHDVQICDCCGDGYGWYGFPGEHYNNDDPPGREGPYAYNGGLCECH
jgi:hypothetical protein